MKNKKNIPKAIDFDDVLAKELKDPEFKKLFDEYGRQLDIAYNIIQLRKAKKMSQLELARKIGTTQSNIARIEGGRQNFTINLLQKVAEALDSNLKVSFTN
ncbi:MAG: helix-turn-helix transcriptional regulator [Patescibacteria group bacterium]|jgi:DNA-binding XRE family transcriptional regulator